MYVRLAELAFVSTVALVAAAPANAGMPVFGSWVGSNHLTYPAGLIHHSALRRERTSGEAGRNLASKAQGSSSPDLPEGNCSASI